MMKKLFFAVLLTTTVLVSCGDKDDNVITEEKIVHFYDETAKDRGFLGSPKQVDIVNYLCTLSADTTATKGKEYNKQTIFFNKEGIYTGKDSYDKYNEVYKQTYYNRYIYDNRYRIIKSESTYFTYSFDGKDTTRIEITNAELEWDDANRKVTIKISETNNQLVTPIVNSIQVHELNANGVPTSNIEFFKYKTDKTKATEGTYLNEKRAWVVLEKDATNNWLKGYQLNKTYDANGKVTSATVGDYSERSIIYW